MKVFIVGGTGLLGSSTAGELIKRGADVVSISLPPLPQGADIPKQMELKFGDINKMDETEISKLLTGCDSLVFAAGVDERVEFAPPVYESYYKYNIQPLKKLLPIAKKCGIKKVVILGSYFSHFAKTMPKLKLYEKHPYIKSRIDQENLALSFSDDKMEVVILELPYIFGAQKGRKPVWMIFVDLLLPMKKTVFFPKGGTTMVTVNQVSQAIAGAVEKGVGGTCYPVGWYNKTWKELLTIINEAMGFPNKKILTIPTFLYKLFSFKMSKDFKKRGIEPGLNPVDFVKLMTTKTFIDKTKIETELGVSADDIDKAIKESVSYCMEIKNQNKKVVEMKAE